MNKIWYTDGACSGNPGSGGCAAIEFDNNIITNIYYEFSSDTTNNREELKAILYVVKLAAEDPSNEYIIYTDSMYCVNTINDWMFTWVNNDWKNSKNEIIKNLDLIEQLWKLFKTPFFNVELKKVPGHSNIIGNELVDLLAKNKLDKFYNLIKINKINNLYGNIIENMI